MPRKNFALAAILAAGWLLAAPVALQAQKALVYCPVGIDATGCNVIRTALSADATLFPGGVDGGYDGSQSTVDLATADLSTYAVFVVPSLADGPDTQPYSLLRDATISARLKSAFVGRTAIWSGTPDVGSTNRSAKDGLIRNLAGWARPDSAGTHGPGLVALQDNSDDAAARYGWLPAISPVVIAADTTLDVYGNVQVLTPTGTTILTDSSGLQIGYSNMASYGLVRGAEPAATNDATGGRSTRVVLVTTAGEPSEAIATIRTDREDYAPGDTVTITGTGWAPGETVVMQLHEDPLVHGDRTLSAVADTEGKIFNNNFTPEEHDFGVRFVLTAVGESSGRTAQTTFTDGNRLVYTTAPFTVARGSCSPTITVQLQQGNNPENGHPTAVTLSSSSGGTFHTASNCNNSSIVTSVTIPTSSSTINFFYKDATPGTPTLTATAAASSCNGGNCTVTQVETITTTTTTSVSSSSQPSVFGQAVTFTATVTAAAGTPPAGSTVTFKDGATTLGTGTLNGSAQATLTTSSLSMGGHSITATYDGTSVFLSSTSVTLSQAVNKASTSTAITADTPDPSNVGQAVAVSYTVFVTAPGSGTPTGNVTVSDGVNSCTGTVTAGSCSVSLATSGARTLTATYAGDGNFNGSTSPGASHQVTSPAVATTLSVAAASGDFGGTASLSATLTASGTPVAGRVIGFTLNGSSAGSATTNAAGTATIAAASLGSIAVGTYPSGVSASFAGDASFLASSGSNALTVTQATAVVSLSNLNQPYDGSPKSATVTTTPAGLSTSVTYDGSPTVPTNAGSYTVVAIVTDPNYTASTSGTLVISPLTLTGHFTADNKEYDGTTAATILTRSLTGGILSGDVVSLTGGSATFGDKHVGTGKTVSGSGFSLTGAAAGNYVLASATLSTTADITQRAITVTAATDSKIYDGTTSSSASPTITTGSLASGDAAAFSQAFDTKDVGTGKTLTSTGSVSDGNGGGNYLLTFAANHTGVIQAKGLIGSITAADKDYDGNASATITNRALSGLIGSEDVSYLGGTAAFDNRNAGSGKTVTATGLSLAGTDAANYTVNATAVTTASIHRLAIEVTAASDTKVYDGTTVSTATPSITTGTVVSGDTPSFSQTFDSKNVGTGKTLTPAGSVNDGNGGNNYDVTFHTNSTGEITARALAVQATGVDKVYDGNTAETVTLSDDRVPGDALTLNYAGASFADRNAGIGKPVSVTGITVTGADAGNYNFNTTASTTATISPRAIEVTATTDSKTYDGTTTSSATPTITDGTLVGGDSPNFSQVFDTKHVGNAKTLTASGAVNDGNSGNNYAVIFHTNTGVILARDITVTASADTKVYDGTANSSATPTITSGSLAPGDTPGFSESFDTKHVGTGKTLTPTGAVADGNSGNNYAVVFVPVNTGVIQARPVTPVIVADDKPYDGTTTATLSSQSVTGTIAPEVVTLIVGAANFDTKHAGTNKTVTVSGLSLSGADAGDYALNAPTATDLADITPIALLVTAHGVNKVYDHTTAATVTLSASPLSGDVVTLNYTSATFADKNVGAGKTVTVSGITTGGVDGGNYLPNTTASTTADITPAPLTVTATGINKVYDAGTTATVTLIVPVFAGDAVTGSYLSAAFSDKNVGLGKTVNVSGISIAGADTFNYELQNTITSTTANITKRDLTVNASAANKYYDGTTTATVTLSVTPIGTDVVTISFASGNFDTPNVGTGKTVTVLGVAFGGADGGNYSPTPVPVTTTASILSWTLTGFYAPVDMPTGGMVLNSIKGGQTVPLKFEVFVGSVERTDVGAVKSFVQAQVSCPSTTMLDDIEITSTGGTVLRYDSTAGQFIQNWQTPKTSGSCYRVTMSTQDGASLIAYFKTK